MENRLRIGIVAVQGAFIEHGRRIEELGGDVVYIRSSSDLKEKYDGLILPGGESSVQGKLIDELGLVDGLTQYILTDTPILATCAGAILMANEIEGQERTYLKGAPIKVKRNAYGRQLGSFRVLHSFGNLGEVPMTFIRAPYISKVGEGVEVLATYLENIVAVRYKNQFLLSFHPELDEDTRIHQLFLDTCLLVRTSVI